MRDRKHSPQRSPFFAEHRVEHQPGKDKDRSEPLYDGDRMLKEDHRRQDCEELSCGCDDAACQRSKRADRHKDEMLSNNNSQTHS